MSGTVGTPSGNRPITSIELGVGGVNVGVFQAWIGTASGNQLVFGESVTLPASIFAFGAGENIAVQSRGTFESDGDIITFSTDLGTADVGDWVAPKTDAPGTYEIRATLLDSSDTPSGTFGTWLALTSNRSWTLFAAAGAGTKYADILIEIRLGTIVLDSCVLFLESSSFPPGGNE